MTDVFVQILSAPGRRPNSKPAVDLAATRAQCVACPGYGPTDVVAVTCFVAGRQGFRSARHPGLRENRTSKVGDTRCFAPSQVTLLRRAVSDFLSVGGNLICILQIIAIA
jgi:hypothetical protein